MRENSIVKRNILYFIESQGITKYELYQKTGISNGVLSQKGGMSEDNTIKFLSYYSQVSADWLLTGRGDMLRKDGQQQIVQTGEHNINHGHNIQGEGNSVEAVGKQLMEIIREKDKQIESLHKIIDKLSK